MGEKCGELASRFAAGAGHERNKFAVKPCLANQQTRRNRNAHPAILQDIDRQARAAGSEFTVDAQVVVNACERGFNWRRLRIAFDGIGPRVKVSVFIDRQDDPAWRMGRGLSQGAGRRSEQESKQTSTEKWQAEPFFQRESCCNSCGHTSSLLIFKMDERISSLCDPGTKRAVEWIGWRAARRWLFH